MSPRTRERTTDPVETGMNRLRWNWPRTPGETWTSLTTLAASLDPRVWKQAVDQVLRDHRDAEDLPREHVWRDVIASIAAPTGTRRIVADRCPICDDTGFVYAFRLVVTGAEPKHTYTIWLPPTTSTMDDLGQYWPLDLTVIATAKGRDGRDACLYSLGTPVALRHNCAVGAKVRRGGRFYEELVLGSPVPVRCRDYNPMTHTRLVAALAERYGYPAGHAWAGWKPDEVPRSKQYRTIREDDARDRAAQRIAAEAVREAAYAPQLDDVPPPLEPEGPASRDDDLP